jgi:hypothetical protein
MSSDKLPSDKVSFDPLESTPGGKKAGDILGDKPDSLGTCNPAPPFDPYEKVHGEEVGKIMRVDYDEGTSMTDKAIQGGKHVAGTALDKTKEVAGGVKYGAEVVYDKTSQVASNAVEGIKHGAEVTYDKSKEIAQKAAEGVKYGAEVTYDKSKEIAQKTAEGVKHGAEVTYAKTKEVAGEVMHGAEVAFDKTKEVAKGVVSHAAEGVKSGAEVTYEKSKDLANKAVEGIKHGAEVTYEKGKEVGSKVVDTVYPPETRHPVEVNDIGSLPPGVVITGVNEVPVVSTDAYVVGDNRTVPGSIIRTTTITRPEPVVISPDFQTGIEGQKKP